MSDKQRCNNKNNRQDKGIITNKDIIRNENAKKYYAENKNGDLQNNNGKGGMGKKYNNEDNENNETGCRKTTSRKRKGSENQGVSEFNPQVGLCPTEDKGLASKLLAAGALPFIPKYLGKVLRAQGARDFLDSLNNENKMLKIIGVSCGVQGDDVSLRRFYGERLGEAGLGAVALPPMAVSFAAGFAKKLDGLVLSGGGDIHPGFWGERLYIKGYQADMARDEWELALCREFLAAGKPVLGICRGMQALNVALGGDIWQDLGGGCHRQRGAPEEYGHPVFLAGRLREAIGGDNIYVNSLHHQGVRRLGRGLRAAAYAPDGLVEAVFLAGAAGGWALGVQWHPERLADAASLRIWRELARAAGYEK